MSNKLFKDSHIPNSFEEYLNYIDESTKPIGFGDAGDAVYEHIKKHLFISMYHLVAESGASFDSEIFFNSIIDDLNQSFDTVGPMLLMMQRRKDVADAE